MTFKSGWNFHLQRYNWSIILSRCTRIETAQMGVIRFRTSRMEVIPDFESHGSKLYPNSNVTDGSYSRFWTSQMEITPNGNVTVNVTSDFERHEWTLHSILNVRDGSYSRFEISPMAVTPESERQEQKSHSISKFKDGSYTRLKTGGCYQSFWRYKVRCVD